MKRFIFCILFFALITACAPSPVEMAKAEKIRLEASAEATQAAIENHYRAALNTQDVQRRYEIQDTVVQFWTGFYIVVGSSLVIVLAYLAGAFGIYTRRAMKATQETYSGYIDERAKLNAKLIAPNPRTRMLPAIADKNVVGVLDTGLGLSRNEPTKPDHALTMTNAYVRGAGVISENARKANGKAQGDVAGGLSRMQVPMIEITDQSGKKQWVPVQEPEIEQ